MSDDDQASVYKRDVEDLEEHVIPGHNGPLQPNFNTTVLGIDK
jgi:hypothetical protein